MSAVKPTAAAIGEQMDALARETVEVLVATGLTPRQLAEQRDELADVLGEMTQLASGPAFSVTQQQKRNVLAKAAAALAKVRGGAK